MTVAVYDFPSEWYSFSRVIYRLRAASQSSNRPWTGGSNIHGPHVQFWVAQLTMSPQEDPIRQEIDAFFARIEGRAGLLRIADASRLRPWYDRNIVATVEAFSDGTRFTDSTGFASGYLPPSLYVSAAADKGDNYLVLAGLPASTSQVMRRGDLLQVNPDGEATSCPNLYQVVQGGSSDAAGKIGVEVRPRLRMDFAPGDPVQLRYAGSVFRLIDDDQAAIEITPPVVGNLGFSLMEALDQVP